jgi:integrase
MYRKKGSPYWWIAYRDASGRKIECSTQTTDRSQAALVESERRGAVWLERQRGLVPAVDPLFDDVLADYLEAARARRDIETDIHCGRALARSWAGRTMRQITPALVLQHVTLRRAEGVQDSSIRRELAVFSAAIHHARRQGWDGANPLPAVARDLKTPPGRTRWLTREQVATLQEAAARSKATHLSDFITLALHTGMRRGELLYMEWARVDLHHDLLYLDTQKNGQRGSVPLNGPARHAVLSRARFRAEHCPDSRWLFSLANGQRVQCVWTAFNAACRRAGIADFHVHDLRHTCAAWLVQDGAPLLEVANLLRHSSIVMTQRYAHLAPTAAREAVARLEFSDGTR